MSVQLYGRRVVVTGASSGIGKATARAIVDAGGRVALLARRGEILEEIASDLGASAAVAEADVTDPTAVAGAVARAAEMLGGLDGLVNVAGLNRASPTIPRTRTGPRRCGKSGSPHADAAENRPRQ